MLSLNDEISKFEKQALVLKDDTMSIDERFFGGGLTIKDLIVENSFIISEMRKMKDVFINYCKLNDKVYKKIVEHEVSANHQLSKVSSLASGVERRLESFTEEMKQLKESTISEMKKNREETDSIIEGLEGKMKRKVNEEGFQIRIKKIIDQYEEELASDGNIPSDINTDTEFKPSKNEEAPKATGKKKRGLTMEDIEAFTSKITPLIDQVSVRVDENKLSILELNQNCQSIHTKINKATQQSDFISQDLSQAKVQLQKTRKSLEENDEKILSELREKTSNNQWESRFADFQIHKVLVLNDKLSKSFQRSQEKLKENIKTVDHKITSISIKTQALERNWKNNDKKIENNSAEIMKSNQKVQEQKHFLLQQIKMMESYNIKMVNEIKNHHSSSIEERNKKIAELSSRMEGLAQSIENQVFKKVQLKLGKQMKEIRLDIVTINKKISESNKNIRQNFEQVSNVKDVVASKANFTDFVVAFDKKADKEEINMINQKIRSSSPQPIIETYLNKESTNRLSSKMKRRKSSFSKRNTPFQTKGNSDEHNHKFGLDWETPNHHSEYMKTFKETNSKLRHKSLRPSTANTNTLFLL